IGCLMADDGAETRMHERRVGTVAGLRVVGRSLVVALLADNRAYERDMVHVFRQTREPLADLDTFRARRDGSHTVADGRAGMRIECFELTRTALKPQNNDRPRRFTTARTFGPRKSLGYVRPA